MYHYTRSTFDVADCHESSLSWSGALDHAEDDQQSAHPEELLALSPSSHDSDCFFHRDPAMSWALNVDDNESLSPRRVHQSPSVDKYGAEYGHTIAAGLVLYNERRHCTNDQTSFQDPPSESRGDKPCQATPCSPHPSSLGEPGVSSDNAVDASSPSVSEVSPPDRSQETQHNRARKETRGRQIYFGLSGKGHVLQRYPREGRLYRRRVDPEGRFRSLTKHRHERG